MVPRHREIAAALRGDITRGALPVGEPLPSEAELCRRWGVSRGPVRQALAALRAEGLIETSRGRPPTVRAPEPTQTLATFTPFSHWARRIGAVPGSRTLEVARTRAAPDTAAALGLGEDAFVVRVVRARYLDGEPAMLERSVFTEEAGRPLFDFDTDSGSITDFLVKHGAEFAAMRHVLDAVAADAVDADALAVSPGGPLLRERRTSFDLAGVPFEHSDDRYRPDVVTFSIANAMADDPRQLGEPDMNL